MSRWRTLTSVLGTRGPRDSISRFWTPSLTAVDPSIPSLPLETPASGASVALSGSSVTASAGTLGTTSETSVALTGSSVTASAGTLVANPGVVYGAHTASSVANQISVTTGAISTTAGSTLVVFLYGDSGVTLTPSDSQVLAWTQAGSTVTSGAGAQCKAYYSANNSGSGSHTFTSTASSNASQGVWIVEVLNADTSAPFDTYSSANDTSSPFTAGSGFTNAQADEMLVAFIGSDTSTTFNPSESSGFTRADALNGSATLWGGASYYLDPNSVQSNNPSFTEGGTSDSIVFQVGIKGINAGAVSIELDGESVTTSAGTLGVTADVTLTGSAVTASAGTVAAAAEWSVALSGEAVAASAGTLGIGGAVALSGSAVTASAGTVTPAVAVSVALSGEAVASAAGTLGVTADVALTGSVVSADAGTVGAESGVFLALTGEEVTSAAGTLSVSVEVAISGSEVSGNIGTLTAGAAGAAEEESASGGWGWGLAYERYLDRQKKKRKREIELEEAEEQAQQLRATEREIATLLHEQERQDLERAESERLLRMARRYADSVEIADKLREAMAKAAALETFGALEALKRELERTAEEEEVALLLILNQ